MVYNGVRSSGLETDKSVDTVMDESHSTTHPLNGRKSLVDYTQLVLLPHEDEINEEFNQNEMKLKTVSKFEYHGPDTPFLVLFRKPTLLVEYKKDFLLKNRVEKLWKYVLPEVILGPVIGLVTDTTARVLIQISKTCETVVVALQEFGKSVPRIIPPITKHLIGGIPAVFAFDDLTPGTYYKVHTNLQIVGLVNSGFRTLRTGWCLRENHANIAFVSQNTRMAQTDSKLSTSEIDNEAWKSLYQLGSRGSIDMIVHLGGAVILNNKNYQSSRSPSSRAKDIFHLSLSDSTKQELICKMFREVYFETWTVPFVRHTLANCPNMFIMSADDLGIDRFPNINDMNEPSFEFILRCALSVYDEYQTQLYQDNQILQNQEMNNSVSKSISIYALGNQKHFETSVIDYTDTYSKQSSVFESVHKLSSSFESDFFFNKKELSYDPSSLLQLHLHVMGDIGFICLEPSIGPLLQMLNIKHNLTCTIYHITEQLDRNSGTFKDCRFIFLILPYSTLNPVEELTLLEYDQLLNTEPKIWQSCNTVVAYTLQALIDWKGDKEFSKREFCLVTSNRCGSSFEEILWNQPSKTYHLNILRRIPKISVPPISRELLSKRCTVGVWWQKVINKEDFPNWMFSEMKGIDSISEINQRGYLVFTIIGEYAEGIHPVIQRLKQCPLLSNFAVAVIPTRTTKNQQFSMFSGPQLQIHK